MSQDQVQTAIRPHLKATAVKLGGESRGCWVFDWAGRDDDLTEMFSDMFGDGSPDGFEMQDDDTLIPFAVLGITARRDADGQPEGVLFVDTAEGGQIVRIDVDGTARVDSREVVAPSLAALELR